MSDKITYVYAVIGEYVHDYLFMNDVVLTIEQIPGKAIEEAAFKALEQVIKNWQDENEDENIRYEIGSFKFISQEHFDVLNQYINNVTPY